ncbi:QacE family quaternary ammonium compound efflux SMR transporter, partial [Klebsiella pneumoniae]|nr:QacE family quaternary ammonium compound efflux SMR transporter [Klebsiella pneumoniae]
MFNLGFLWLALSIGSEITGTSMIKKTNGFS